MVRTHKKEARIESDCLHEARSARGSSAQRRGEADSQEERGLHKGLRDRCDIQRLLCHGSQIPPRIAARLHVPRTDRKSTRLNSSHVRISYAVFCLKKKTE